MVDLLLIFLLVVGGVAVAVAVVFDAVQSVCGCAQHTLVQVLCTNCVCKCAVYFEARGPCNFLFSRFPTELLLHLREC